MEDISYLNAGVGHALRTEFEKDLKQEQVTFIEGEFYPEGAGAKFTRLFYERHGYYIIEDDNKTFIEKHLPLELRKEKTFGD